MLLTANTIVHTPQGDRIIGHLAASGQIVYCFTWERGKITVGRAAFEEAGIYDAQRVVLDNGKSVITSLTTMVVDRSGVDQELRQLTDKSVMPLYLSATKHGYPIYRQVNTHRKTAPAPSDRKPWRSIARMVWESRSGQRILPGFLVRHLDRNRKNCHPDNLRVEGKPQRKPRKTRVRRHISTLKSPGNHRVVGCAAWNREFMCRVVPIDCRNVALSEIFVVAHGT